MKLSDDNRITVDPKIGSENGVCFCYAKLPILHLIERRRKAKVLGHTVAGGGCSKVRRLDLTSGQSSPFSLEVEDIVSLFRSLAGNCFGTLK